jgi:hypothetical protein
VPGPGFMTEGSCRRMRVTMSLATPDVARMLLERAVIVIVMVVAADGVGS